ncbi:hypothetical protein AB0J74_10970 [Asanoa sp. NPDC049573]|uniref:WD40 repeat domain-containing protein n=1 Tax=Asanoa sp. NPDC049573 TaxID=3155396 RepID=UPI00342C8402
MGRSTRRRRLGAAALGAVAALLLALSGVPFPVRSGDPTTGPSLPGSLAGYSMFTGSVTTSPPGRAIALYGYGSGETFNMFQPLVVGADRNTYRRVDAMQQRDRPSALLAPDGTRVLLGDDRGATGDLVLVDLATGERRSIPLGAPVGVRLLAWSPDGRYVAYSAAPVTDSGEFGSVNVVDAEIARSGTLRILDLSTGRSTTVPALTAVWTAAFAPDSRRLAVQVGQTAHLVDIDGRAAATVDIAAGRELAADVGWSPDGQFLATVPWASDGPFDGSNAGETGHGVFLWKNGDLAFVPVTDGGGAPAVPVKDVVRMLGWRTPQTVIVATMEPAGNVAIVEVRRDTGTRRTLSLFDAGNSCELHTQPCQVFDLHLATGLLPDLAARDAGRPQRGGPWPLALNIVAGVAVIAAGWLLWRTINRRTRRQR